MARTEAPREQLATAAGAALGRGRRLAAVERLAGGSRKGVYRLRMDDATTAIAYRWVDSENYWPVAEGEGDLADPFSAGVGLDLFEAAHARLASLGLRVPAIHLLDRPAELAIVEDFPGGHLMDRLAEDPAAAGPTVDRLAEALVVMRRHRGPAYGKVALIDRGGTSRGTSCESAALGFALRCLADATGRDRRVAAARDRLADRLWELAAIIRPRDEYAVVHGELGLDHVLVDAAGEPVLIDVEDLMYFDVEWEHVFLRIRLGADYERLAVSGLDEDRLALYLLTQRLSLTAGPLRLLEGDYPDRAFMSAVAEHNLTEALALVHAR